LKRERKEQENQVFSTIKIKTLSIFNGGISHIPEKRFKERKNRKIKGIHQGEHGGGNDHGDHGDRERNWKPQIT